MHFGTFSFGSLQIDDTTYEHDIIIDRGAIRKRKKRPSKPFRDQFGHTPLSVKERFRGGAGGLLLEPAHTAGSR